MGTLWRWILCWDYTADNYTRQDVLGFQRIQPIHPFLIFMGKYFTMKILNFLGVLLIAVALIFIASSTPAPERYTEYSLVQGCGLTEKAQIEFANGVNLKIKE